MSKTRRWSEKRGREVVGQWRRSGLSISAFARERGLETHRLRYWRDRLEDEQTKGGCRHARASKLVPGVLLGLGTEAAVNDRLASGVIVEIRTPRDVGPEWVAQLLRALEETR